jgi:hypothetical protein
VRATVQVWDAENVLAEADAVEVRRDEQVVYFMANLQFKRAGRAVMVRYLKDGEPFSQVTATDEGQPTTDVAILPKLNFETGEELLFSFAGHQAAWTERTAQGVLGPGGATMSFNIEIHDPKTGETQVIPCVGTVASEA